MTTTLQKVKFDLATSESSTSALSGMGGNPSQLYFLLSHEVDEVESADVSWASNGDRLTLSAPKDAKVKAVREALAPFYESHADKRDVSSADLVSPEWLASQGRDSSELKALAEVVAVGIHARDEISKASKGEDLTDEQVATFVAIDKCPDHLAFFVLRNVITVNMLADYDLDMKCPDMIDRHNQVLNPV